MRSSQRRSKTAQFKLTEMYKQGDKLEGFYHKTRSLYRERFGVRQDDLESSKWFIFSSGQGNTDVIYELGKRGNMDAFYDLGDACWNVQRIDQDRYKALKVYEYTARHKKHIPNTNWQRYSRKANTEKLIIQTPFVITRLYLIQWQSLLLREHVPEQRDIELQYKVGITYENHLKEPNHSKALKRYQMAASKSHREAIYRLGILYKNSLGVFQDYKKAIRLFEKAKGMNSSVAIFELGRSYYYGYGVLTCYEKAEGNAANLAIGKKKYHKKATKYFKTTPGAMFTHLYFSMMLKTIAFNYKISFLMNGWFHRDGVTAPINIVALHNPTLVLEPGLKFCTSCA
ncbi:hypothetical protein K501DRAFT_266183 [Backusella circina FSU 941]|nr:hypothetical protein K501DRAFT_266183 [Backusella circina FSU 941]